MCSAHRGQKRASDLLKLQLEMVVTYHVVLGIEPRDSGKAASALSCQAISLAPLYLCGDIERKSNEHYCAG